MTPPLQFVPVARAKRGTGPRTSKQMLKRRRRLEALRLEEMQAERRSTVAVRPTGRGERDPSTVGRSGAVDNTSSAAPSGD